MVLESGLELKEEQSCPQCGKKAVMLITPPSPERSSVVWCEAGHVLVMIGHWIKRVFDFETTDGAYLISAEDALEEVGAVLEEFITASCVPPCCSVCAPDHDFVEPDGYCQHGFPSILIKLGLI